MEHEKLCECQLCENFKIHDQKAIEVARKFEQAKKQEEELKIQEEKAKENFKKLEEAMKQDKELKIQEEKAKEEARKLEEAKLKIQGNKTKEEERKLEEAKKEEELKIQEEKVKEEARKREEAKLKTQEETTKEEETRKLEEAKKQEEQLKIQEEKATAKAREAKEASIDQDDALSENKKRKPEKSEDDRSNGAGNHNGNTVGGDLAENGGHSTQQRLQAEVTFWRPVERHQNVRWRMRWMWRVKKMARGATTLFRTAMFCTYFNQTSHRLDCETFNFKVFPKSFFLVRTESHWCQNFLIYLTFLSWNRKRRQRKALMMFL